MLGNEVGDRVLIPILIVAVLLAVIVVAMMRRNRAVERADTTESSRSERMEALVSLRDTGAVSEEEFQRQRRKLLDPGE